MQKILKGLFSLEGQETKNYKKKKVRIYSIQDFNHELIVFDFLGQKKFLRCFTGNSASHAIKCCDINKTTSFFKSTGKVSDTAITNFRFIHYADKTTNGSGKTIYSSKEMQNLYPKKCKLNCEMLNRIQKDVTYFTLLTVENKSTKCTKIIDGIMHIKDGKILFTTTEKVVKYFNNKEKQQHGISRVGFISCQKFTRTNTGKHKTQFKIHQIEELINDINNYYTTKTGRIAKEKGDNEEILRTKQLNNNKEKFINIFDEINNTNKQNVFFMHIDNMHNPKDEDRKIYVKSDIVLIYSEDININLVLKGNDGYLSEKMLLLCGIKYNIIPEAGISVKCGNGCTYQRYTRKTFLSYFPFTPELCALASCYSTKEEDLDKNKNIYIQWTNQTDIPSYLYDITKIKPLSQNAKQEIIHTIENNRKLKERIFTGKGVTDDKYVAKYMMWDGILKEINIDAIHITFNNANGKSKNSIPIFLGNKSSFNKM